MAKIQRLNKTADFNRVSKVAVKIHTAAFLLLCAKKLNINDLGLSFGVICSRKVGGAVVRNRAKRLLREVVRRNLNVLMLNQGLDFVLIAKSVITNYSYASLEKDFLLAFSSALIKMKNN